MKNEKTTTKKTSSKGRNGMKPIKLVTIVLAIVLVTMVSFVGVYKQNKSQIENQVRDYKYSMAINGARKLILEVCDESEETATDTDEDAEETAEDIDEESEEVTNTDADGATTEEVEEEDTKVNSEDVLTVENYELSKKIIEHRLKYLGVQDYIVALDEETGKIEIELEENDNTDTIVSNLNNIGKFEIVDSETEDVLINNDYIKSSSVLYNTTSSGTTIYLDITFNSEGKKKLKEISETYATIEEEDSTETTTDDEDENEVEEEVVEDETEENEEITETDEEEETEETDEEETSNQKQIIMRIDDEDIMTTSFDDPITTGSIQLSVGSASTDSSTIQDYATQARAIATKLDGGMLPIEYDINGNEYVLSNITEQDLVKVEIVVAILALIGIIILVAKYKMNGLLAGFAFIGLAAIYMLIVRYTNVVISIESIVGIIAMLVLNYIFTIMLLKNVIKMEDEKKENPVGKATKETYKVFFLNILPICILAIVFSFMKWVPLISLGTIAFWGIALIAIYNVVITKTLIKIKAEN